MDRPTTSSTMLAPSSINHNRAASNELRASVFDAALQLGLLRDNQFSEWMFDEPQQETTKMPAATPSPMAETIPSQTNTSDMPVDARIKEEAIEEEEVDKFVAEDEGAEDGDGEESGPDSPAVSLYSRSRHTWLNEQARQVEEEFAVLDATSRALAFARKASTKVRPSRSFRKAHRFSRSETTLPASTRHLPEVPVPKNPEHRALLSQKHRTPSAPSLQINSSMSNAPYIMVTAGTPDKDEETMVSYESTWRQDVLEAYDLELSSVPSTPQDNSPFSKSMGLPSPTSTLTSADSHQFSSRSSSPVPPVPYVAKQPFNPVGLPEVKPLAVKPKAASPPISPVAGWSTSSTPRSLSRSSTMPRRPYPERPPPIAALPSPPLPPDGSPKTSYPSPPAPFKLPPTPYYARHPPMEYPPIPVDLLEALPFEKLPTSTHSSPGQPSAPPAAVALLRPSTGIPPRPSTGDPARPSTAPGLAAAVQGSHSAPGTPPQPFSTLRSKLSIKRMKAKIMSATGKGDKGSKSDASSSQPTSPLADDRRLMLALPKELPPLPKDLGSEPLIASPSSLTPSMRPMNRMRSATLPGLSSPVSPFQLRMDDKPMPALPPIVMPAPGAPLKPGLPSAPAMQRGRHAPFPIHPIRKRTLPA
ncbi:hypothetical protein HGRIS_010700 [Hohenbuehelia grisea]|uniref:Uncharacterized protein n=1 Tax=Hohenbuehelia grisea TaxID=104357 RepID=A0ABR3IXI7_9AGAR